MLRDLGQCLRLERRAQECLFIQTKHFNWLRFPQLLLCFGCLKRKRMRLHLENLNPMIFAQRTPVPIDLSTKINFSTKIAQDYIWTHTIIEYSDVVWDNCTLYKANDLEKIQIEAPRIVTGATKISLYRIPLNWMGNTSLTQEKTQTSAF